MLPAILANDSINRVRPVLISDHGRHVADWSQPPASEITFDGVSVQPGATAEVLENRTNVTIRWSVFISGADADVLYTDGMRYRGRLYQVDGEPARWRDPMGQLDHTMVLLIDWEG